MISTISSNSVCTVIGVSRYDSNVDDYIIEYLTNNQDVIYFNYVSQIDYVIIANCKEALKRILDELSTNLKNIFETELLR